MVIFANIFDDIRPRMKPVKAIKEDNDKFFRTANDDDVYGYVCAFLFEMPDGTNVNFWKKAICHQALPDSNFNGVCPNAMVTSLWYNLHEIEDDPNSPIRAKSERYWTWLLSDQSPYKEVTKGCEIIYRENGEMCAVRLPNAGMVVGPLLGNFCIATRWPREHKEYLYSWCDYVDAGFTGTQAMYLANHIWFDRELTMCGPDQGHYPFNPALSWSKLGNGGYTSTIKEPFYIDHRYRPCNEIWDHPEGKALDMYSKAVFKLFDPDAEYHGSFPNLYKVISLKQKARLGIDLPNKIKVIETLKKANHEELFSG